MLIYSSLEYLESWEEYQCYQTLRISQVGIMFIFCIAQWYGGMLGSIIHTQNLQNMDELMMFTCPTKWSEGFILHI